MNRESKSDLDIIKQFALSLLSQNSLEDLCWDIAINIGKLLRFEDCVIYLVKDDFLIQTAAYGIKNPTSRIIKNPIAIRMGEGIVGTVAKTGVAEYVPSVAEDPRYITDQFHGQSELTVPIIYEDRVIGIIDSESSRSHGFGETDLEMLSSIANVAASRIASAITEREAVTARQQLEIAKRELEQRVALRTRELRELVQELESRSHELNVASNKLQEKYQWLEVILNSIQDGIIATDSNLTIRLFSKAAERITGWKTDDAVGQNLHKVFQLENGYDFASLMDQIALPMQGPEKLTPLSGESETVVVWNMSPLCYVNESPGAVLIFRDVTREQFLEREAEKAQRVESLGLLAGGIAHDFNNLLQSILSNIQLARFAPATSTSSHLDIAEETCIQASQLSGQFLTFAKGGEPVRRPENIVDVVSNAVRLFSSGSGCAVRLQVDPELQSNVELDSGQISQALGNLLLNAEQAMQRHGEIVVSIVNQGPREIAVKVRDQGCGIEPMDLEKIFDPYYSTKDGNAGIGLTTAYFICKKHRGDLLARSKPGLGSEFEIRLPNSLVSVAESRLPSDAQEPIGESLRVLVMDDEPIVRSSLAMLLSSLGHHVSQAEDGLQAISQYKDALFEGQVFDLVLLDLTIPGGMGGAETMRRLQELDPNAVGIISSGYSGDQVIANYRQHGFSGVLCKPFSKSQLQEQLVAARELRHV